MSKYVTGYRAKTRADLMRYILLSALLLLTVSVIQVSILSKYRILGSFPDLMLCSILCLSYFCGSQTGAVMGLAGGFLIDAMGGSTVLLLPLIYMLFGYLTGHYAKTVSGQGFLSYLPYLGVALGVRLITTLTLACILEPIAQLPRVLLFTALPQLLLTALAGLALYAPLWLFCGFLEGRRKKIR